MSADHKILDQEAAMPIQRSTIDIIIRVVENQRRVGNMFY
jgi:hypothetical protein